VPGSCPISDVILTPLRRIDDERGAVFRMLRADDAVFRRFGEVYFTAVNRGAVKGWRRHLRATMNCAVPVGRVLIALYDDRRDSPTFGAVAELVTGPDDYFLVTVPPGIWSGFKGLADGPSLVANCADLIHDPAEVERVDIQSPAIPIDLVHAGARST
jgi:dTDP-4-dehydrorhamnose 3,5-epimerase